MNLLKSWIDLPAHSDFSIYNLPFGIFETPDRTPRVCSAIGNFIIDLTVLEEAGCFDCIREDLSPSLHNLYLNDFISLGKKVTTQVREKLIELLREDNPELQRRAKVRAQAFVPMEKARLRLPVKVGNYTDFYSSIEHATNVGQLFRDPEHALFPNWKHLPVGYHGRPSSIIPSGTPIKRPNGQILLPGAENPVLQPTAKLDFEMEMAFITGKDSNLGETVRIEQAEDYIFGFVLFNDWSARDIQRWEYVPLGPFLSKSFGSSISPWVVTLEALEHFRVEGPVQDQKVLPYLQYRGPKSFDIRLSAAILPFGATSEVEVSSTNFKYMYWNVSQQLAHQTVGGCNIQVGDLYASGTLSGPTENSYGSMLELTWNGKKPLKMSDGSKRSFIQDGDTVILRGYAEKGGIRVGFGEVSAQILAAGHLA